MSYLTVNEVTKVLGISSSKAYVVIRQLNNELKAKGYITIAGKISAKFFLEKYYCDIDEVKEELRIAN